MILNFNRSLFMIIIPLMDFIDLALLDSAAYAARSQLKYALSVLEKHGQHVNRAILLPDAHPGPEIFPDGLYINIQGEGFIGTFSKDIACGMAFGKVDPSKFPPDTQIQDILEPLLGGGNHFMEIQQVVQVNSHQSALLEKYKIQKDDYILLLHSGADDCGESLEKWVKNECEKRDSFYWCSDSSGYAEKYEKCFHHSKKKRREVFAKLKCTMMNDSVHNQYILEADGSKNYFMSSNASNQGDLLPIPASFGDFTAFVHPTGKVPAIPHGAGRLLSRSEAKGVVTDDYLKESNRQLFDLGTTVICPSESRRRSEDPKCYRKMQDVVQKLVDNQCIETVFATKPLKTFKV